MGAGQRGNILTSRDGTCLIGAVHQTGDDQGRHNAHDDHHHHDLNQRKTVLSAGLKRAGQTACRTAR